MKVRVQPTALLYFLLVLAVSPLHHTTMQFKLFIALASVLSTVVAAPSNMEVSISESRLWADFSYIDLVGILGAQC